MPSERTADVLQEIKLNIDLATSFVSDMSASEFERHTLRLYATIRALEIISEASRRLPDDLKVRHPHIQWREMAGAGNIYRHDYDNIAAMRIWETVRTGLPPLLEVIISELDTGR